MRLSGGLSNITRQQLGDHWGGHDDLLDVVQHEQQLFVAQKCLQTFDERSVAGLLHVQRLGDDGGDQVGVADRRERHKADPRMKGPTQVERDLQAQARFADSRWAE